jgi:hypothetical protein
MFQVNRENKNIIYLRLVQTIFKNSIPASKGTQCVFVTKFRWSMLFVLRTIKYA